MKILLFGSIAAGKTEIANEILKVHPGFEYIAIDDYRRKYGDGSMLSELTVRKRFIAAIKKLKNQIIEASGLGELGYSIFEKLADTNDKILLVILYSDVPEIMKRVKKRIWDIPFPGEQENLDQIIQRINLELSFGKIETIWAVRENLNIYRTENLTKNDRTFIINFVSNFINTYNNDSIGNNRRDKKSI